jgi:enoyl-CoA hydratase/carnithine racemase
LNPEHCLVERDGHVLTVTLNRPEAKNALSGGMMAGMYRAWRMLDEDPELRVGILTGRVVPSGQTLAEAKKIAAEICDNGPLSIRALMRMLREIDESYSEADALAKEIGIGGPVFASKDAREGPRAFAEKRKPVYTGQ